MSFGVSFSEGDSGLLPRQCSRSVEQRVCGADLCDSSRGNMPVVKVVVVLEWGLGA